MLTRIIVFVLLGLLVIVFPIMGFMGPEIEKNKGDTVILVHGLGRSRFSMINPAFYLRQRGFRVINLDYPSTEYRIQILADKYLQEAIDKCEERSGEIHFVTHSLGGIIVRYYLKNNELQNLGRVVMLSPPNQGSELVDVLGEFPSIRWRSGPAVRQLTTERDSLPNRLGPVNFETGIIAGNRSYSPLASLLIPGEDDGKVGVEGAKVANMKDFIIVPRTHTFIMNGAEVKQQIAAFLERGEFKKDGEALNREFLRINSFIEFTLRKVQE